MSDHTIARKLIQLQNDGALLLSIRSPHADRIFDGSKRFELRKVLPARLPKRVYLYEAGGRGVVGSFDVGRVISSSPRDLWSRVGISATTERRFHDYFGDRTWGNAIEVLNPVRFTRSVPLAELRKIEPSIHAPQSFLVMSARSPARAHLESIRKSETRVLARKVVLRPIKRTERSVYVDLVRKHVGRWYDDIDDSFAHRNLDVSTAGQDPFGFFTSSKEVLAVCKSTGKLVGFTTLTYKLGGSVKSGPTIILSAFRKKGFGLATRRAIIERVRERSMRKVYCTCPDAATATLGYLLASGMRVEGHLERHYSRAHGELVLGQMLVADEPPLPRQPRVVAARARILSTAEIRRSDVVRCFRACFEQTWFSISGQKAGAIIRGAFDKSRRKFADKPRSLVLAGRGTRCLGMSFLVPKRGGACKALMLIETEDTKSIAALISATAIRAVNLRYRKLYFVHPLSDGIVIAELRRASFHFEGVLRAPYVIGQDVGVLAKFI